MKTVGVAALLVGVLAAIAFSQAGRLGQVNRLKSSASERTKEAEVSPGEFLTYREYLVEWELADGSWTGVHAREAEKSKYYQQDTAYLAIPWAGKEIRWVGVGIPICLREWKKSLYMITFDRDSDFNKIRFRFYRQDHYVLAETEANQFPREIATQNLWLRTNNGMRNDRTIVNEVEIAKTMDPSDWDFQRSLTAKIWFQLETGKQYYDMPDEIEKGFLSDYLKRYNVIRLKEVQRQPATGTAATLPATQPAAAGPASGLP